MDFNYNDLIIPELRKRIYELERENEYLKNENTILKQGNATLNEGNAILKEEYVKTNIHLTKYTSPQRNVEYYHRTKKNNKDNPEYKEKRKEINKRAYQKRKAKLLELKKNNDTKIDTEKL